MMRGVKNVLRTCTPARVDKGSHHIPSMVVYLPARKQHSLDSCVQSPLPSPPLRDADGGNAKNMIVFSDSFSKICREVRSNHPPRPSACMELVNLVGVSNGAPFLFHNRHREGI